MPESFDVQKIRADFPMLLEKVKGNQLVYLDSAATSLKPKVVVDRISRYYLHETANVHRGAHHFAQLGTRLYEEAREEVRRFIGAAQSSEVIFTRGTTESINLVVESYARKNLRPGDEVILSELEHHSNLVPWQRLCQDLGCVLRVLKIDARGDIEASQLDKVFNSKTRMLAITWCSNVLGTVVDVRDLVKRAHAVGAKVLIDAAQAVMFLPVDVQDIDCDFLAFSGHKMFAPFGIGVLYAKHALLLEMDPYQTGGSMIDQVTWDKTTWADLPHKFEAGTPNVSGALALAEAIRYLQRWPLKEIQKHEDGLRQRLIKLLRDLGGFQIYGADGSRTGILSFNLEGVHHSDLGQILDQQGIAVRTGHHCCQPLMEKLGVLGTVRVSFAIYNSESDLEHLQAGLQKAKGFFT